MGDISGGKIAAGARFILDHELLAERITKLLRKQARGRIGGRSGTESDDDAYRMRRVILGAGNGFRLKLGSASATKRHAISLAAEIIIVGCPTALSPARRVALHAARVGGGAAARTRRAPRR